jgi:CheY-like chemotaxis protein
MARAIRNILLVEDDGAIRDSIAELLEGEGYRVIQASNGAEALERLRTDRKPDLIVLDLTMPVMDGWQFRDRQEHDPHICNIPVLVISADHALDQKVEALHADGWLAKPFALDSLLAAIGRVRAAEAQSQVERAVAN